MCRQLLIAFSVLFFTSCNYLAGENGMFRDRGSDYRDAQVLPPMTVPPGLDSYTLDQLYVVPEELPSNPVVFDRVPLPKPIETGRREGVIIQSINESRWIIIDATPAQVWPLIRDYWAQLQVILDYENPSSGIMETAWLEVDSDLETRHKYRIGIEPGLHSGYSEIYVLHLENLRSDPTPVVINWPQVSSSTDRERQILDSISQYLADRNDVYQASSASFLAGSIESERKANLVQSPSGGQVLQLRLSYERAWVVVRSSLESANIDILDSNRDEKFINVRFSGFEDEEAPGFFGRLFGRDRNDELASLDFSLKLLETGTTVDVVAESSDSSPEALRLREQLLQAINENLI